MVVMATREVVRAGPFAKVYDPTVGEHRPWCVEDHALVRADDGRWHLFGITRPESAEPCHKAEFAHAVARDPHGPWTKRAPALTVDPGYGETQLRAPHVIASRGRYYMFYAGGGPDRTRAAINLATSSDLFRWTRAPAGPLFRDGYDARDPMILRLGEKWVMYYCATGTPLGGHHVVCYRLSTDLTHWGDRHIAYTDPTLGTDAANTQSPFVVPHNGSWFLFIGPRATDAGTDVFRSDNPFRFRIGDKVGHIRAHAAELVEDAGQWWITSAGRGQRGLHLARLTFPTRPPTISVPR